MAARAPFPTEPDEFGADDRVSIDKLTQTYKLTDKDGEEWEWLDKPKKWARVTDEAMIEQQQQAYIAKDDEESEYARSLRIRKGYDHIDYHPDGSAKKRKTEAAPKQKGEAAPKQKEVRSIYVTSLPQNVTEDELYEVFSKYGVIAESLVNDEPRIKLYYDDEDNFKGEALIVYFRPESVRLAINMLDECDFRLGQRLPTGPMRVTEADTSFKRQKDQPLAGAEAKKAGTNANRERKNVIEKNQEMNSRLADWDDDDPSQIEDTSSRWDKVVVLKHMFTPKELDDEPEAYLDIKEDVRDEAERFGKVTNVIIYDKEEDGVITVRFANATAAQACIKVFDGRKFDGRIVKAYNADGSEKFQKRPRQEADDAEEKERQEKFSKAVESGAI